MEEERIPPMPFGKPRALASALMVLLSFPALARAVPADSTSTKERSVTQLAEGVYEIRHPDAPDTFPQGNTTVVIGERGVLVVDSCYLPSSAREDIAQIRKWTTKPVRYLFNTHWHFDHTMGNSAYVDAFPGIEVVAQSETRNQIAGYNPGWFERFPKRGEAFQKEIDSGKDASGKALTPGEIEELKTALAGLQPVWTEFQSLPARLADLAPKVAFEKQMDIDLGNRVVQLRFLGRGNTAGDGVAYLPKEKILVAGDLLDHPVPYLGGGYPFDEVETLRNMAGMDAETIVPGHGDVLHGKDYLNQVIRLIGTVTAEVKKQVYLLGGGPRNLEAVRKAVKSNVDLAALRREFTGDNQGDGDFFDDFSVEGLITAAYAQCWPK